MTKYPKIQNIYKRDHETNKLIEGQFTHPEFEYLQDNLWIGTEKVDGTNIRVLYDPWECSIAFKGRTDKAQIPLYLLNSLMSIFRDKEECFAEIFERKEVCLYGEGYGAKIQKGGGDYKRDGQDFVLFDIKVENWWLQREKVEEIAKKLRLFTVPTVHVGWLCHLVSKVKEGVQSAWGDFEAEGLVARPLVDLRTQAGERIILKIKARDFRERKGGK